MKNNAEYTVNHTVETQVISTLFISSVDMISMGDKYFEEVVNNWIEKVGGTCKISAVNGDIRHDNSKSKDRLETRILPNGLFITLKRVIDKYNVCKSSRVIIFDEEEL